MYRKSIILNVSQPNIFGFLFSVNYVKFILEIILGFQYTMLLARMSL